MARSQYYSSSGRLGEYIVAARSILGEEEDEEEDGDDEDEAQEVSRRRKVWNDAADDVVAPAWLTLPRALARRCGPCRAMIPHLAQLSQKYSSSIDVLSITQGEPVSKIGDFIAANERMSAYAVGVDRGGDVHRSLDIAGIPHAALFSTSNELVWRGHPASPELDAAMARLAAAESAAAAAATTPLPAEAELRAMSVKQLRALMTSRRVSAPAAIEKSDLVDALLKSA